jgi:hypothetical protein
MFREMASQSDPQLSDRRLNSWKSIGAFFERDERTVKRWDDSEAYLFTASLAREDRVCMPMPASWPNG